MTIVSSDSFALRTVPSKDGCGLELAALRDLEGRDLLRTADSRQAPHILKELGD